MAKLRQSKSNCWPHEVKTPKAPEKFKDRNIAGMSAEKGMNAVAPSESVPIRSRLRMAGAG